MTAYTAHRTWVTGELVTAALMNTYVRDNGLYYKEQLDSHATTLTNLQSYAPRGHFAGLHLRSHPDADQAANKVMLVAADEIMMSDGVRRTSWALQTCDLSASGANGLDTGAEAASTWYSIHAITKSSDGTKALLAHKAPLYTRDQTQDSSGSTMALRDASARTRLGQSFQISAGIFSFADVRIIRSAGTPSGRVWLEVCADSSGSPGTILATSDKLDASKVSSTAQDVRFIFRSPATLSASTTYHLVMQGDYTINGTDYLAWAYQAATNPYANGTAETYNGVSWAASANDDFRFRLWIKTGTEALTFPTGYDQSCLIGYAYNDGSSNIRAFHQQQRHVRYLAAVSLISAAQATPPTVQDASTHMPPTPCKVWQRVSLSAAGDVILGPVPDGYRQDSGADVFVTGDGADGVSLIEIDTDYQGIYYRSTVNANVLVEGFEWLR